MKVQERSFSQLLKHKKTFAIPAFQRRYAWKKRNFSQLWEDIKEVIDGTRKRHFMGTVVFQPDGALNLSVIDGQQRLATFTIMLKVLHDLSDEYAKYRKKTIEKFFTHKGHPLLRPSLHDRSAFAILIDNPSLLRTLEHRCVKDCYDYFTTEIQTYITSVSGQKPTKFAKIYNAIVEKMVFVEILLADDDDTHAIFETINYSGVPLTAADLARNFVLSQARNDKEQNRLNSTYWEPLEHKLSESLAGNTKSVRKAEMQKILPEFLRAVLVVEKQKYISSTDLFRELRAYFRSGNLEDKLKNLLEHATEYCKFLNPSLEGRRRIQSQLLKLLDLRMTTYNPVLLVLFRSNANGGISANDLVRAMQFIESFIVRRAFNSKVSRDLPKVFAKIASQLSAEMRGSKLLKQLVLLLREAKWPDDSEFRPCFLSTPIYATAPAMARFALIALEAHGPVSNERVLDNSIQIEHVFPQSAKQSDWASDEISDLKKGNYILDSLAVLGDNSSIK